MYKPSEKLQIIKKLKKLGYGGYFGDALNQLEQQQFAQKEPKKYDLGGPVALNSSPSNPRPAPTPAPATIYRKTPFQEKINIAAKSKGLNENQIKALYVLNGVESKSGTDVEDAHYSRDGIYKNFGGTSKSGTSLSNFAKSKGWYKNGKIVGESTTWTHPKTKKTHTVSKKLDDWIRSVTTARGKDSYGNRLDRSEKLKKQEELFNTVYSDKYGRHLNNDADTDGWLYRGRGGVQLTGKANYEKVTKILNKNGINVDLVKNPELAADERYSADILIAFAEKEGMFNPNSEKYLSNKDYELIAQGDVDTIDKLHNITNAKADDERMIEEASNVYGFKNPIKRSKERSLLNTPFTSETEGNEFRKWVNDNHSDYAKNMGNGLKLDPTGKFNNHHIKKAWKELGEDFKNDKDSTLLPEVTITAKRTKSQPAEPLLPKSIASNLNETLNVIEEEKLKLTPRPRRKEAKQNAYYKNNALDFIRSIDNYKDELYQEREKAYGGLIKTKAPQRYVGKAYQDRKHHTGFMEGDLNMYMANGGELDLSPKGGPKARPKIEEISNDYNADGIMKARIAYDVMHGNPGAKRLIRKGVGTRENYLEIEKDVKKFADKYVTSDHHRKLLEKYNYPEDKIHWRMQDILNYNPDRDTRFALSGNSYVGGAGEHFPIKEGQQKGQPIVQYNLFNPHPSPIDQVVSHEWGHIPVSSGFNPLSEEERNEFISRLKPGAVKNEHDAEPQENRSDQFELRYFLDKAGIYDSSTGEEFTQKHLDDYREKTGTHHRMFNLYGDEDIIWLMNNIAAVNNGEELNMAKYGGPLSGSNSGGPKKKKGTVGIKSTDSFMSNAYFNETNDGVPFKSNMGEIIDLNLPQPDKNSPIRFNPYVSGNEKGMYVSGNASAQLTDNLSVQGGVGKYYDFSPEAEESEANYNLGLRFRFPNKKK